MKALLVCCIFLAACCPDVAIKKAPIFDARLMEECVPLKEADIKSFDDVIVAKASDTKAYIVCKNTHKGLVDSVKKYQEEFNK